MKKEKPELIFNTHKFLFSLFHEGKIKGHIIEFEQKDGSVEKIEIVNIEIGASPISAKFYDINNKRHIIPFLRIKKIYYNDEIVWDCSDVDTSNVKIIKGFK